MKLEVIKGDITKMEVDAIVNAANSSLMGGGGVDGAIHRAGGPSILEACREIVARQGTCPPGQAVITVAGKLPAKFVIHTVGPVWQGGQKGEAHLLASCYTLSMMLAIQHNCHSIAFPNISTGVYGYPKDKAAQVSMQALAHFLTQEKKPDRVIIVCFDEENYACNQASLRQIL